MKRTHARFAAWAGALLSLLLAVDGAVAATATPNVSAASTSEPKLDATGTAWAPFGNALGVPNASKSIRVLYLADDVSVYPLDASSAAVQLRPGPSPGTMPVNCTYSTTEPVLDASNGGSCTFRMISTAGNVDTLEVFHLGLLSGAMRLTATGLTATGVGNDVAAYDSDTVLGGTAPAPDPAMSRKPARLVLVFDKSGSMDWTARHDDPACGSYYSPTPDCRRWNVLRRAAGQMVSVAKAYHLPTDQIGVVFFNHEAETVGAGLGAMSNVTLDAVLAAIDTRSPGGNTSIGDGIGGLLGSVVGAASSNADFNNAMLVFSDGAQNSSRFLAWDGSGLVLNTTNTPIGGDPVIPAGDQLKLCPFRLRIDDPADSDSSALLNAMADTGDCGLQHNDTVLDDPPGGTIQYFLQVLAETLIGDKLEMIHASSGAQPQPAGNAADPIAASFRTSRQDLALTVLLGWNRGFQADGLPNIRLHKDGVEFDPLQNPRVLVESGGDHVALTMRAPFCNAAGQCVSSDGEWTLEFVRTLPRGEGRWNLFVLGDNASIASTYAVTQDRPGIGEPLQLKATLTEGGQPLTGLAPGSVRAFVSGPSEGLGNVLSASNSKPIDAVEGDAISAAGRKAQAMLADPAQRDQLLAALELGAEQGIALAETAPGVYTAEFPATLVEGNYRVGFRIDGEAADNGAFTRVYDTDRYVQVRPDPAATAATLTHSPAATCAPGFAGGCVQITLRPVDAAGNLVGPGKSASFHAVPFDGEIVGPVTDHLDGSYSIVVGYTSADATPPTLRIDGLPLDLPAVVAPGDGAAPASGIWHLWWLWLLLLLLLIAIFLWWRKRTP